MTGNEIRTLYHLIDLCDVQIDSRTSCLVCKRDRTPSVPASKCSRTTGFSGPAQRYLANSEGFIFETDVADPGRSQKATKAKQPVGRLRAAALGLFLNPETHSAVRA